MAIIPTLMNESIADYAEKYFSAQSPALSALLADAESSEIPNISIGGVQGAFLQMMITVMQARTVIEIGSLAGYSAITMALAMKPGGIVHCFEKEPHYCAFIRRQAEICGMSDRIIVHEGDAIETLSHIQLQEVDLVFIDADKPRYVDYMHAVIPMVKSGGIVIGDNALAWGNIADENPTFEPENVKGLQRFNQAMRMHPHLHPPCIVPLGDGMCISVKK